MSVRALFFLLLPAFAGLSCAPLRAASIDIAPPAADGPAPEPAPPAPERAPPGGPGCSWVGGAVYAHSESIPLCFAVDGACFARAPAPFQGTAVRVTLAAGDPAVLGAHLELAADGIRIGVWTAGDAPILFPKVPVVFGGVAIPRGGPGVHVERVRGSTLDLVLRPSAGLKVLKGDFRAHASCSEVDIGGGEAAEEAVRSVIGRSPGTSTFERVVPLGHPVTIAEQPEGPGIAEVTADDTADAGVEVLAQRGARSRILWWQAETVYFGWVDSSVLQAPPLPGGILGASRVAPALMPQPPLPGMKCPMDMPLHADFAGTKAEVGVIERGTRFDVKEQRPGMAAVRLRTSKIELEDSAEWLVPAELLLDCSKQ